MTTNRTLRSSPLDETLRIQSRQEVNLEFAVFLQYLIGAGQWPNRQSQIV
jgi:hypothetical protein